LVYGPVRLEFIILLKTFEFILSAVNKSKSLPLFMFFSKIQP
jgi:hypothetical protein